jgi:hypothetical protein
MVVGFHRSGFAILSKRPAGVHLRNILFEKSDCYSSLAKIFHDIILPMKNKIWIRSCSTFKEARKFAQEDDLSLSPEERLETVQFLRELAHKLIKGGRDEDRKRLRRVVRVIQQE